MNENTTNLGDVVEVRRRDDQMLNLDDLKSRESSRIATAEDVKALLEAEFRGIAEIQKSQKISDEEFRLIEDLYWHREGENSEFREASQLYRTPDVTLIKTNYQQDSNSLRHETKLKRHVLEEVVLEDSERFYEKTFPKKSKRFYQENERSISTGELRPHSYHIAQGYSKKGDLDDSILREHNIVPIPKPRKNKKHQSEIVLGERDLFKEKTGRNIERTQDLNYLINKENLTRYPNETYHSSTASEPENKGELVVEDIQTFKEGQGIKVNRINKSIKPEENTKKYHLNETETKIRPKPRIFQGEIVLDDKLLHEEVQRFSPKKSHKLPFYKTRVKSPKFKNKFRKAHKTYQLKDKNEDAYLDEHQRASTFEIGKGPQEEVILENPDIFREASSKKKKYPIVDGTLEKSKKKLDSVEKDLYTQSFSRFDPIEHKGPQKEIYLSGKEIVSETTLTRPKKTKLKKSPKILTEVSNFSTKILESQKKQSEDDTVVLTKMEHKEPKYTYDEDKSGFQKEIVVNGGHLYDDKTRLTKTDPNLKSENDNLIPKEEIETKVFKKRKNLNEIIIEDNNIFEDKNRPKRIHLSHGKVIQLTELDEIDIPEMEEEQVTEPKKKSKKKNLKKFKKSKKQGESVVDKSFVYEDATNIGLPTTTVTVVTSTATSTSTATASSTVSTISSTTTKPSTKAVTSTTTETTLSTSTAKKDKTIISTKVLTPPSINTEELVIDRKPESLSQKLDQKTGFSFDKQMSSQDKKGDFKDIELETKKVPDEISPNVQENLQDSNITSKSKVSKYQEEIVPDKSYYIADDTKLKTFANANEAKLQQSKEEKKEESETAGKNEKFKITLPDIHFKKPNIFSKSKELKSNKSESEDKMKNISNEKPGVVSENIYKDKKEEEKVEISAETFDDETKETDEDRFEIPDINLIRPSVDIVASDIRKKNEEILLFDREIKDLRDFEQNGNLDFNIEHGEFGAKSKNIDIRNAQKENEKLINIKEDGKLNNNFANIHQPEQDSKLKDLDENKSDKYQKKDLLKENMEDKPEVSIQTQPKDKKIEEVKLKSEEKVTGNKFKFNFPKIHFGSKSTKEENKVREKVEEEDRSKIEDKTLPKPFEVDTKQIVVEKSTKTNTFSLVDSCKKDPEKPEDAMNVFSQTKLVDIPETIKCQGETDYTKVIEKNFLPEEVIIDQPKSQENKLIECKSTEEPKINLSKLEIGSIGIENKDDLKVNIQEKQKESVPKMNFNEENEKKSKERLENVPDRETEAPLSEMIEPKEENSKKEKDEKSIDKKFKFHFPKPHFALKKKKEQKTEQLIEDKGLKVCEENKPVKKSELDIKIPEGENFDKKNSPKENFQEKQEAFPLAKFQDFNITDDQREAIQKLEESKYPEKNLFVDESKIKIAEKDKEIADDMQVETGSSAHMKMPEIDKVKKDEKSIHQDKDTNEKPDWVSDIKETTKNLNLGTEREEKIIKASERSTIIGTNDNLIGKDKKLIKSENKVASSEEKVQDKKSKFNFPNFNMPKIQFGIKKNKEEKIETTPKLDMKQSDKYKITEKIEKDTNITDRIEPKSENIDSNVEASSKEIEKGKPKKDFLINPINQKITEPNLSIDQTSSSSMPAQAEISLKDPILGKKETNIPIKESKEIEIQPQNTKIDVKLSDFKNPEINIKEGEVLEKSEDPKFETKSKTEKSVLTEKEMESKKEIDNQANKKSKTSFGTFGLSKPNFKLGLKPKKEQPLEQPEQPSVAQEGQKSIAKKTTVDWTYPQKEVVVEGDTLIKDSTKITIKPQKSDELEFKDNLEITKDKSKIKLPAYQTKVISEEKVKINDKEPQDLQTSDINKKEISSIPLEEARNVNTSVESAKTKKLVDIHKPDTFLETYTPEIKKEEKLQKLKLEENSKKAEIGTKSNEIFHETTKEIADSKIEMISKDEKKSEKTEDREKQEKEGDDKNLEKEPTNFKRENNKTNQDKKDEIKSTDDYKKESDKNTGESEKPSLIGKIKSNFPQICIQKPDSSNENLSCLGKKHKEKEDLEELSPEKSKQETISQNKTSKENTLEKKKKNILQRIHLKKPIQKEVIINDTHIYTDDSTLGRKKKEKVYILENDLPESKETSKKKPDKGKSKEIKGKDQSQKQEKQGELVLVGDTLVTESMKISKDGIPSEEEDKIQGRLSAFLNKETDSGQKVSQPINNIVLDSSKKPIFDKESPLAKDKSTENVQLVQNNLTEGDKKQIVLDTSGNEISIEPISSKHSFKAGTSPKDVEYSTDGSVDQKIISSSKNLKLNQSPNKNTAFFSTLPAAASCLEDKKPLQFVVVAIDFGTTFSGYAFSFTRDVDSIHVMKKWEGGDPGVTNQKTPTILLLSPQGEFHSFGFTARDFYHDLSPKEAQKWMYFEKFKMALHYNADLSTETEIKAVNGKSIKALEVFSHALKFFRNHALQEIGEQSSTEIFEDDVKWVITVPAIWKAPAKQFMREAAYKAGIASPEKAERLLIALEPEAASVFVRKQRLKQLLTEDEEATRRDSKGVQEMGTSHNENAAYVSPQEDASSHDHSLSSSTALLNQSLQRSPSPASVPVSVGMDVDINDNRFMVADCGGGTADITVYEMLSATGGKLNELYKASGGPYGSIGVDLEFERLLKSIFMEDFIEAFKMKRPAGWVDLMMAFESRKRAANPFKEKPLNVPLPFSFIDYHKKFKNSSVESAVKKFNSKTVLWSSQGMLRLLPDAMRQLFQGTLDGIVQAIRTVINQPDVAGVTNIFMVGGFSESPMLQQEIRKNFASQSRILIPNDVSLTILKGAVLFGIDPSVVVIRKSRLTYGLGVLNRFIEGKHPEEKRAWKGTEAWCVDVFDMLVMADQSVAIGSSVIRSYTPASNKQKFSLFHIYCSEQRNVDFVTDDGVAKCGTLRLDLDDHQWEIDSSPSRAASQALTGQQQQPSSPSEPEQRRDGEEMEGEKRDKELAKEEKKDEEEESEESRREIQARLTFGDTEIKIIALDVTTGNYVRATLDFLNK